MIIPAMTTFFLGVVSTALINAYTNAGQLTALTQKVANLQVAVDEMNRKRDTQDDKIGSLGTRMTTLETEFTFFKPVQK